MWAAVECRLTVWLWGGGCDDEFAGRKGHALKSATGFIRRQRGRPRMLDCSWLLSCAAQKSDAHKGCGIVRSSLGAAARCNA